MPHGPRRARKRCRGAAVTASGEKERGAQEKPTTADSAKAGAVGTRVRPGSEERLGARGGGAALTAGARISPW